MTTSTDFDGQSPMQVVWEELGAAAAQALPRVFECFNAAVQIAVADLAARYDGNPADILYGTPLQARAFRAAVEHGDVVHLLHAFVDPELTAEDVLAARASGFAFPTDALAAEIDRRAKHRMTAEEAEAAVLTGEPGERDADRPGFEWMTVPELRAWLHAWVEGAWEEAEEQERRDRAELTALAAGGDTASAEATSEFSSADRLLLAAARAEPRGFAAGDREIYQRMETLRKRVRRRK